MNDWDQTRTVLLAEGVSLLLRADTQSCQLDCCHMYDQIATYSDFFFKLAIWIPMLNLLVCQ